MRILSQLTALTAAGLLAVVVLTDEARAQSRSRGAGPALRTGPGAQRRGSAPSGAPAGSSGTIQWNTPNSSGNLGGPGAGGGGTAG